MNTEFDLMARTMALIDAVLEAPRMSDYPLCPICHYMPLPVGEAQCTGCDLERIERETRYEHHRRERAFEESQKEL